MAVRTLAEDVVPGGDLDVIVVSLPGGVGHLGGVAALGHLGSLPAVLTTQGGDMGWGGGLCLLYTDQTGSE